MKQFKSFMSITIVILMTMVLTVSCSDLLKVEKPFEEKVMGNWYKPAQEDLIMECSLVITKDSLSYKRTKYHYSNISSPSIREFYSYKGTWYNDNNIGRGFIYEANVREPYGPFKGFYLHERNNKLSFKLIDDETLVIWLQMHDSIDTLKRAYPVEEDKDWMKF